MRVVLFFLLFYQPLFGMSLCCDQHDEQKYSYSDLRDLENQNHLEPGPQMQLQHKIQILNHQIRARENDFREKHEKDIWCLKKSIAAVSALTICALGLSIMNLFYHPFD